MINTRPLYACDGTMVYDYKKMIKENDTFLSKTLTLLNTYCIAAAVVPVRASFILLLRYYIPCPYTGGSNPQ